MELPPKDQASAKEWLAQSRQGERNGDYLGACDAALMGLEQFGGDRELQHCAILNLSRAGARNRAEFLWKQFGMATAAIDGLPGLDREIAALGARLARERGFAASGPQRLQQLHAAAEQYAAIYRATKSTFPGINAAVLYQLSDDSDTAREIADEIAAYCETVTPLNQDEGFQLAADLAAACLLLDRIDTARHAIAETARLAHSSSSIASTRKQLTLICEHKHIDLAVLAPLRNRAVVHYTGHMISADGKSGRFPADQEARVAAEIEHVLVEHEVGFGFGSLASGADLLVVETMLRHGGRVEAILPFEADSFRAESVAPAGGDWAARFNRALPLVSVAQANDGDYAGDAEVFAHTSRLAMGMAILKAQALAADLFQIAVWDGYETDHPAGTFADIRAWRARGLKTIVIRSGGGPPSVDPAPRPPTSMSLPPRQVRAIMFGDFKGFSKLSDQQLLAFFEHVMGLAARVLDRYDAHVRIRNTWGDGLFVVFDGLVESARCALELQAALAALDLAACGLPPGIGLRLAIHAGAVFEIHDAVLRGIGFTGSHINRTARLEPVTPSGDVYVTEQFAALLMLEDCHDLRCDYVGLMAAAKDYGRLRMYLLTPTAD